MSTTYLHVSMDFETDLLNNDGLAGHIWLVSDPVETPVIGVVYPKFV